MSSPVAPAKLDNYLASSEFYNDPYPVSQMLRDDGTTQRSMRVAIENVEMGGHQIGKHQLVFAMVGAPLARPETRIAINTTLCGLKSMPVRFR